MFNDSPVDGFTELINKFELVKTKYKKLRETITDPKDLTLFDIFSQGEIKS